MKVFVIAGEASGDKLGAALMAGLRKYVPDIAFDGVGGPLMQGHELSSRFPMDELSVMGLTEVLPKLRGLFARRDQMVEAILADPPDALITIDSPDFCLRVVKKVKAARPDIPSIHYVAPSVWAWRPKRAQKMARIVDHVLALLPMEPPLMQAAGVSCDFVGHPIVAEPQPTAEEVAQFRAEHGLTGTTLTLLPGSRRGEVTRLAPVFCETLEALKGDISHVVLPAAQGVVDLVSQQPWPIPVTVLDPRNMPPEQAEHRKRVAFAAGDIALAASGTVALELMRAGSPMVIAYRMAPLSAAVIRQMLISAHVSLPNILAGREVVPELLQERCRADLIAESVRDVLAQPNTQKDTFADLLTQLGQGGADPGERAARSVLSFLDRRA